LLCRFRFERRLGSGHLPEMIHGHNTLVCTHEASGVKLCFDAFPALQGWLEEAAPPLDVAIAEEWKNSHDLEGVKVMRYDWTYTTCYHGSVDNSEAKVGAQWSETSDRIDRDRLSVHEPILFFDEVTLYESELDDNGVAQMSVKVRVMPSGWYVLMRFWLRVDGVLMRVRDTRFYCPFDCPPEAPPTLLREICYKEEALTGGAAAKFHGEALTNADIAQQLLPTKKLVTERLLTLVN